ncbi:(2Fe-2S)-binding protein [Pseudoroseomonas sp. WGS1072]|uniref:(2Fe-2S)-binding protein n=1 Tax=Roseomonas sp. WGS1072 TaxID=3366816 RepID=UPI003BF361C1
MFQRLPEARRPALPFLLDGAPAEGREGDSVAAALLALGQDACRESAVSGQPRGGYCMMGVCFDCLMVIDGIGNRQACLTPLRAGMVVETQRGRREPAR